MFFFSASISNASAESVPELNNFPMKVDEDLSVLENQLCSEETQKHFVSISVIIHN